MNTIYIIIRTIKGSNYSTILRTYQQNEKQKAKAELKLLRKGDIIYDYKLKEYQEVKKSGGNIMKIENEITGHVKTHTYSRLQIELWIKDEQVDFFTLDLEAETVVIHVEKSTRVLLGMRRVYEDYIKLIADLGLDMPSEWKKHWIPSPNDKYYCVDSTGEVYGFSCYDEARYGDNERIENYNMFPTKELTEKACNVSKLGRLILLWQYANDCLFEPDWLDGIQYKYHIIYDTRDKNVHYDYSLRQKSNNIYFETREQAEAFIKMYEKEIKEIMGGI